ncbi:MULTISPECIES: SDR family oxidoreductase [unclassified Agreia]|uniref:SDR family oxidoreductase n=1 Tax=unclassified Agreia TaxID=2641148 RepID=UPI0006F52745|nr:MULTISPECIES: SDR family oxidoreductase [Microbacteriaceae]KQM60679.1 NAD-dependent dehydratase [Agreia sp. Leaf210]KQR24169.1 NAD-dependent dehydratase [Agreia sp. Leaf335]PPF59815.1 SDR family NAD(P)-dependent oxidoreductase [Clavibacter michiganensis]
MRIAIAGGHGKIALILQKLLSDAGHEAVGLIRNPDHAADLLVAGGIPVVLDLEQVSAETLAADLAGVDAVVFAAGAGPDSGADRKLTVDRDAAVLLADAAVLAGIRRYVMISAMSADSFEPDSDDVFQVYLRAKSEADSAVRQRDLDWTIIRPGALTDDPGTGLVHLAESTGRGSIPRADVAALVFCSLVDGVGLHAQFEAIEGDDPVAEALTMARY